LKSFGSEYLTSDGINQKIRVNTPILTPYHIPQKIGIAFAYNLRFPFDICKVLVYLRFRNK
jgi:hypothetical protein